MHNLEPFFVLSVLVYAVFVLLQVNTSSDAATSDATSSDAATSHAALDWVDVDAEHVNDPMQVGVYAAHIFSYYKEREVNYPTLP